MGKNLENSLIIAAGLMVIVLIGLGAARLLFGTIDLTPPLQELGPALDEPPPGDSPAPAKTSAEREIAAVPTAPPPEAPPPPPAPPPRPDGDAAREAASADPARIARSTVFLVFEGANGKETIRGSGFVLDRGIVVTNYKLVSGTSLDPVSRSGEVRRSPDGIVRSGGGRRHQPADVLLADLSWDVAFLWVPDLDAPSLELASDGLPEVDAPIVAPAPPRGLEAAFRAGRVLGASESSGLKVIAIDVPIPPALRGAPVVDEKGRAIGMMIPRLAGEQAAGHAFSAVDLARMLAMARGNIPKK